MGSHKLVKFLLIASLLFTFSGVGFCTPSTTMSITPTASSGDTINASDENARNNEVSTKFNTHSHTDIAAMSGVNTFTIGDGAVGNKTYAVDTDDANDLGLRYNTTSDLWTLTNDGANYYTIGHAQNAAGLSSGNVLIGGGNGVIAGSGTMTNGQLLIGSTGANPSVASLTAGDGITITSGAGTIEIDTATTGFATPAIVLGTAAAAGSATTIIKSDATIVAFDATTPAALGTAATGSVAYAARRDHVHAAPNDWVLVGETGWTNSESGTVAGLDGNTDQMYMVIVRWNATTFNAATMSNILPNSLATNQDGYYTSFGLVDHAETAATNSGFLMCDNSAVGDDGYVVAYFSTRTNADQFGNCQLFHGTAVRRRNAATAGVDFWTFAYAWTVNTNLTSLLFQTGGAGDKSNGNMWVYKQRTP